MRDSEAQGNNTKGKGLEDQEGEFKELRGARTTACIIHKEGKGDFAFFFLGSCQSRFYLGTGLHVG